MKLLLDENLPRKLKRDLRGHAVFTVRDMGWQSKKNGELLALMLANGFEALLTFDRNLRHQQNFEKYPIAVLVLVAEINRHRVLQPLVPSILAALNTQLPPGATVISG
ncbi:MAG: DUF5615 family PIN-like protein [Saprospiraceae bacterium]